MDDAAAAVAAPTRPSRSQQLTTFFRYPEYIRAVGGQLTQYNVLDYFSKSDFYEPSCNNAVLQMQTVALPMPMTTVADDPALVAWQRQNDPLFVEHELRRFVGLEFVVVHAKPPELFVLHKRWRTSPTQTRTLDAYYIVHGNVTMAADVFSILGARMLSTVSALNASLSLARSAQPEFNPREGHAWRIAAEAEVHDDDDDDGDKQDEEEAPAIGVELDTATTA